MIYFNLFLVFLIRTFYGFRRCCAYQFVYVGMYFYCIVGFFFQYLNMLLFYDGLYVYQFFFKFQFFRIIVLSWRSCKRCNKILIKLYLKMVMLCEFVNYCYSLCNQDVFDVIWYYAMKNFFFFVILMENFVCIIFYF